MADINADNSTKLAWQKKSNNNKHYDVHDRHKS